METDHSPMPQMRNLCCLTHAGAWQEIQREVTAWRGKAAHTLSSHLSLVKLITAQSDLDFICPAVSQDSEQRHH